MADRLVVMDHGRVRQAGTPEDVYERPADLFVACFIGRCNIFPGVVETPGRFRAGAVSLPCEGGVPGQAATLVVRPERVRIAPDGVLPGRVGLVTDLGSITEWHMQTDAGPVIATRPTPQADDPLRRIAAGDTVAMDWPPEAGRLLPSEGDTP